MIYLSLYKDKLKKIKYMAESVELSMPKTIINKTHTSWILWYHNPIDKNWSISSYIKIYEFSSLQDFWRILNSWNSCLPPPSEGMFFLMRKLKNGNCINPLWEDKYNRTGGFWSFKISKDNANLTWNQLSIYLIAEQISKYVNDTMMINGISISPKRNFCIIKIWNNDSKKCDKTLLNKNISEIDYNECMYKCHVDNIANDKVKLKKYSQKKRNLGK